MLRTETIFCLILGGWALGCAAPTSEHATDVPTPAAMTSSEPAPSGAEAPALQPAAPGHGRQTMGATPMPCEIAEVLSTSCQGCHSASPGLQAPMALVHHEDLMAPAVSDSSRLVHELVAERIRDEHAPMPPLSSRRLTDSEMATIETFLAQGMPLGDGCERSAPPVVAAPEADEIDQCYRLQAHENRVSGDTEPYLVAPGEYYSCFYFEVPWEGDRQVLSFRSLDTALTHHWGLYSITDPRSDGEFDDLLEACRPANSQVLAMYGQNQQREQHMPPGVGLGMPVRGSGRILMLEVHYFNDGDPTADTTGVEVCTARTPRPETATVSVLGSSFFTLPPASETKVESTCTPGYAGDIHIFRSFPHMHERGVRLESVIERADGGVEVLIDKPFDFNNQIIYETPAVLRRGDRVRTNCHYVNESDRSIPVGFGSEEEMCINFVYAWPANALTSALQLPGLAAACTF